MTDRPTREAVEAAVKYQREYAVYNAENEDEAYRATQRMNQHFDLIEAELTRLYAEREWLASNTELCPESESYPCYTDDCNANYRACRLNAAEQAALDAGKE